jgi:7-cyano-7-deazaguanine synthase
VNPSVPQQRRAVVLLSGGLDSTTVLAIARDRGFECHALSVDYGQRHRDELVAADRIARRFGIPHRIVSVDLAAFGGSALTADIVVPKHRDLDEMGRGIPITYVPARNTVFLSLALAQAEVLGAFSLFIGVNAVDYSGYPDCRPEYVEAFRHLADLATKASVEGRGRYRVETPLIEMTKADIIRTGLSLGVDYSLTSTCYDPTLDGACGTCDACELRLRAFAEVGRPDPIHYRSER